MIDQLSMFGLTETQAKVYIVLLQLGESSSVAKITRKVSVHRREVYRVLRELEKKGIVTESENKRPVTFTATSAEEAVNVLLRQQANRIEYLKQKAPILIDWLGSQTSEAQSEAAILLIDDDEIIRRTLKRALGKEGFRVDTASNGKTGLEKSRRNHYDLALLDLRLPDMDGMTLIKSLREGNPDLKEIIISGYASFENATKAMDEGANAFMTKPVKPIELIKKIREKLST